MKEKVVIIGAGFGGLGSACILAKAGYDVTVVEKNSHLGGRANVHKAQGYTFDMGPSWYLMPDVFEHFFDLLGEKVEDHLDLVRLGPSYRIFFKDSDRHPVIDIFSDLQKDLATFEMLEPGSTQKVQKYLDRAKMQYEIAYDRFMFKNYSSIKDFLSFEMMTKGSKLSVFSKMDGYVRKYFKSDEMQKIMQYTLVFLGSSPYNTPALYSIMSHIDFNMGVFYPQGGISKIPEALVSIAKKHGAKFMTDTAVDHIETQNGKAKQVVLEDGNKLEADVVVSNADIHHTETKLLSQEYRTYSTSYFEKATLAPSALIMYLGVDGEVPEFVHHNLVFSKDWKKNFAEIFDSPMWPTDPSLYICNPNKTDPHVAPEGKENMFVLVPIAPGLDYTQNELEAYSDKILELIEKTCKIQNFRKRIEYKKLFCSKDFESLYNSYKGSALGLAHTLRQTAVFRPDTKSKKVENLYYVGANTNPGIGMPICLMSAELVYKRLKGINSPHPLESIDENI